MRRGIPPCVSAFLARELSLSPRCLVCRHPSDTVLCLRCTERSGAKPLLRPTSPPPNAGLDKLYFLAPYHPEEGRRSSPLRDALLQFKYAGDRRTGRCLAKLFAEAAQPIQGSVDAVTSVPLHPRRLRRRGFNQAAWLARSLAPAVGAPWRPDLLRKLLDGAPQAQRHSRSERARMRATFAIPEGLAAPNRVLLVDDVCTTGTTLAACAGALRSRGATIVSAAVLLLVEAPAIPMTRL